MSRTPGPSIPPSTSLTRASLEWSEGIPRSVQFNDIYFSPENGPAETDYVFVEQNQLRQRWQNLTEQTRFVIGETGFGSGLNFLYAAKLWLETAPSSARLHYLSTELYPLHPSDLQGVLKSWINLEGLSTEQPRASCENQPDNTSSYLPELALTLLDGYPPPLPGFHRITFADGRITLNLLYGDTVQQLGELLASDHPLFNSLPVHQGLYGVDAWFLDGFAPAKNPGMWTTELFSLMASLSRPGCTFATFSAAGKVRRRLRQSGFEVETISGYGNKREMLKGSLISQELSESGTDGAATPDYSGAETSRTPEKRNSLYAPPWYLNLSGKSGTTNKTAAVIGAGIAGCSTANALARRGWQVSLYDPKGIAQGASGNPQGVIYPKLSLEASVFARFNLAGMCYASHCYRGFTQQAAKKTKPAQNPSSFIGQGVILLPADPKESQKFIAMARQFHQLPEFVRLLEKEELYQTAGLRLSANQGLFFPQLGWVKPAEICRQLIEHYNISLTESEITGLHWNETRRHWELTDHRQKTFAHSTVVLANAADIVEFDITRHLPLNTIRGQISVCPATAESQKLRTVICGKGYLAPADGEVHTLGASYDLVEKDTQVTETEHLGNLDKIRNTDPALAEALGQPKTFSGRASLRCVTPDYLPLVGPAPIYDDFLNDFALLRENARAHIPVSGSYWPNLYINCGHGSRGLSYAPLSAQIIADFIDNAPPAVERTLLNALNPARFVIRKLKRGLV